MLPIDYHLHILAVAGVLRLEGLLFKSASKMLCVLSWSFDLCELQRAVGSRTQKSLWGFSPGWDGTTKRCWEPASYGLSLKTRTDFFFSPGWECLALKPSPELTLSGVFSTRFQARPAMPCPHLMLDGTEETQEAHCSGKAPG